MMEYDLVIAGGGAAGLAAAASFIEEQNNFDRLVEASEVLNENGITFIAEGAFIEKIKELWKKFINFLKEIWQKIKNKIDEIRNKAKVAGKPVRLPDAKFFKLKKTLSIDINKIYVLDSSVTDDNISDYLNNNKQRIEFIDHERDKYIEGLNEELNSLTDYSNIETIDFGKVVDDNYSSFKEKNDSNNSFIVLSMCVYSL